MGIIKCGKVGLANSKIGLAKKLIDTMTFMLKEDPTLNLCDDWYCLKCRELERIMNLYTKMANPRPFQKNIIIREILSWRNRLLIWQFKYYNKMKKKAD